MANYKVQNPSPDREFVANIGGVWYRIPAGESLSTDDPRVATGLREYGAGLAEDTLADALDEHAARNREANARFGSAPASEGDILTRQATVDPATGAVYGSPFAGGDLKGSALDDALRAADLPTSGSASDKRSRLADYRTAHAELDIPVDGAGDTGEPATGASYRVEGDPAPGEIIDDDDR